jgi:hypothetical protein
MNLKTKRGMYDFEIVSKDFTRMESTFDALDKRLQARQVGTGYCLVSGERDHHFSCRNAVDAEEIIRVYRASFKGRKVGVSISDNNDIE